MSVNSMDPYKARQDVIEKMNLKPSHITVTYVTVKPTEMTRVNFVLKKDVTMCLHLKLTVMEIT